MKKEYKKIINFLEKNKIRYVERYDGILAFDYPKNLRVFYEDTEFIRNKKGDIKSVHTGKFHYHVSWCIWDIYHDMEVRNVGTQKEVISIIREVNKKFSKNYEQLTLL